MATRLPSTFKPTVSFCVSSYQEPKYIQFPITDLNADWTVNIITINLLLHYELLKITEQVLKKELIKIELILVIDDSNMCTVYINKDFCQNMEDKNVSGGVAKCHNGERQGCIRCMAMIQQQSH